MKDEEKTRKELIKELQELRRQVAEPGKSAIEHKRAEDALLEQKKQVRQFFDLAKVIFVVIDNRGIVRLINRKGAEILGYEEKEVIGKNWYDTFLPETVREEVKSVSKRILAGDLEPVEYYENPVLTKSGEERIIAWHNAEVRDDEGGITAHVSVGEDITDRKRAEEALRESEEKLRAISESALDAVILIDDQGKVAYWNPAAERIFGYTGEEILGKNVHEVLAPERFHGRFERGFRTFSKTGEGDAVGRIVELVARRRDGAEIPVELAVSPISMKGKYWASAIVRDITERKRLEERLNHAMKMEAIGRLAGGVAHDFNNNLVPIMGISHMLLEEFDPKHPFYEDIEEIREAGRRCAELTRQLLAFGRRQVLKVSMLDLNEVIRNMEKMLGRVIGENIYLETRLAPDLAGVKADKGQMEQVIVNMAVNARDAMPRGGKLTIATRNVRLDEDYTNSRVAVTPGRYVMLAVSDTGTGMDEETMARIFEPFFTTKEKGKGTGLGMATAYGVVKQLGGDIRCYSEPGKGTTFEIYMPEVGEKVEEEPQEAEEAASEPLRGCETILLVEDAPAVRKLTGRMLSEKGYKVLEAGSGEEAIELAERHPERIHLVITDVIMPGISGGELADKLTEKHPEIKVIYISGYMGDAIVHHGVLERGINFIQKPFTPDSLLGKVRRVLDS